MPTLTLTLASASPQRRAILEQLGLDFSVSVADVNELEQGPPHEVALENAHRKASAVASRGVPTPILGVDTIVAVGSRIFGKPSDADHARRTLLALSGRRHAVISGLCLIEEGRARSAATTTLVDFRVLHEGMLDWYLASGEWRGRAGGYAIQGRGAALVTAIEGDYLNVVGLPVAALLELMPGLLPMV